MDKNINVFADQSRFMQACGQTTQDWNEDQFILYLELIREESAELFKAAETNNRTEIFDGLLDLVVVAIGAGLSAGFPMAEGWKEVMASNMSKVDLKTGKVLRRDDGKIMKGESYHPPRLDFVLRQAEEDNDQIQPTEKA